MNKKRRTVSYDRYGWFFISFAMIAFLIFTLYPMIGSVSLAFKVLKEGDYVFDGLTNIKRLIGDKVFHRTIFNTFLFLLVQAPVMLMMALVYGTVLNDPKLKFKTFYRTALFVPCVTSLVAYSVLFKLMFSNDGIVNYLLMNFHLIEKPIFFLNDPFWARAVIIIAMTWRWTGYNMMLTMIMTTNGTLQLFDEPMNITGGGPAEMTTTMSQYVYNNAFVYAPNFGYSVTMSYVIVIMVAILAFLQFKVTRED